MTFGEKLRESRAKKGMTQSELAKDKSRTKHN